MKDKILEVLYSHSHASDEFGSPIMDNFEDVASAIMEVLNGEKWVDAIEEPPYGKETCLTIEPNIFGEDKRIILQYNSFNKTWTDGHDFFHPTHWQPLPTPPTQQP